MIKGIIQRPLVVLLLSVMVTLAGIYAAFSLPIKLQPNVSAPFLFVTGSLDYDLAPEEFEHEVTVPIETAAMNLELVTDVRSTTNSRSFTVEVMLKDTASKSEIASVKEELNKSLGNISLNLTHKEVMEFSSSDQMIMMIAVVSDEVDQQAVRRELRDRVVPALRGVSGVNKVTHPFEQYEERYVFELKKSAISNLQEASGLIEELRGHLANQVLGSLKYGGQSYLVRSESPISSLEQLQQFRMNDGQPLMDKVILRTERPVDSGFNDMNGKPYYSLEVYASESASEVHISQQVRAQLEQLHASKNMDWSYAFVWDASTFIGAAVSELLINILIGAVVAAAILLIVFRSMRTTMIIALSMPICIFVTLIAMQAFGYSINIITLMGIGLGTGMIVDACIVVIENIFRKLQSGLPRLEAAVEGTREVIAPVISSVMTTVAVFAPITFLDGMIGGFMRELALTITVSLLASLVVAISLIPILARYWMRTPKQAANQEGRIIRLYSRVLDWALRWRWTTLLSASLVLLIALGALIIGVPKGFMPNVSDRSLFINFEVEENLEYERLRDMMDAMSLEMLEVDGVGDVLYWGSEQASSSGSFIMLYDPEDEMNRSDQEVEEEIKQLFDRRFPTTFLSIGAGQGDTSGRVSLSATSSSMRMLADRSAVYKEELKLIPGVTSVETSTRSESREWIIHFSRDKLRQHGVSQQEAEQYLRLVLNGISEIELTVNGESKKASLVFPDVYRQSSQSLHQLVLRGDIGLTLGDLAQLSQVETESSLVRQNAEYQMPFTIYFEEVDRASVLAAMDQWLLERSGEEVRISYSGLQQQQSEAFQDLLFALVVSCAAVFLILTIQFNRLRQPFLIMVSLPYAMIGVTIGFIITNRTFDVLAMIGLVMLLGVIVNNGIIMIDFINRLRRENPLADLREVVKQGALLRLRPIMTTTLTTVGGLIPMFIGGTESSSFQTPLATAVIFGLLFSTMISLVILPIFYTLFEGRSARKQQAVLRAAQVEGTTSA